MKYCCCDGLKDAIKCGDIETPPIPPPVNTLYSSDWLQFSGMTCSGGRGRYMNTIEDCPYCGQSLSYVYSNNYYIKKPNICPGIHVPEHRRKK